MEKGPKGGCFLVEDYRTNLTGMTEEEIQALFMLSIPAVLGDLGLKPDLENVFRKLSASLSGTQQKYESFIRQRFFLDSTAWFADQEPLAHLQLLQQAVWKDRRVKIRYRKGQHHIVERIIDPLGLVAKNGIWYLVRLSREQLGVYRVSRIQSLTLQEDTFTRPIGFDLHNYWQNWCRQFEISRTHIEVQIRFDPQASDQLAEHYGEGIYEKIINEGIKDENGLILLWVRVENLQAGCKLFSGLGDDFEVLQPEDLRELIKEKAKKIIRLYD
jgi:predicted DNA-binding transcriptional regulator YafY